MCGKSLSFLIRLALQLILNFTFLLDFGPGQLTSHYVIPSYEVGLYEPTVFKLHPPLCGITEHGIMPVRLELSFCFILLIHEKWFPLGH